MRRVKTLVLLCAMMLLGSLQANAQKYGVLGGATFTSLSGIENSSKTGWNAGATVQFKLPLGFSIQPSLMYNAKASNLDLLIGNAGLNVGYLELPVSFQWGPDLILFRPFLDVTPFVGYGLTNQFRSQSTVQVNNTWEGLTRWEYGVGTGLGLDIWKFQIIARYNWNLGHLTKDSSLSDIAQTFKDRNNFSGVTLSLALLF